MRQTWRGRTWGEEDSAVQILTAQGLEDLIAAASNLTGGSDGASPAALRVQPKAWVNEMIVFALSDEAMAAAQDDLKAATWPSLDRVEEHPLGVTIRGEDERTVFARVTNRSPITDLTSENRMQSSTVMVAFESTDPNVYTAATVEDLEPGGSVTIDAPGWAPAGRWVWVVNGPVTNPMLSSTLDATARVRFVGTVPSGKQLVVDLRPNYLATELDGVNVYGAFDGGPGAFRPPQWFPVAPGLQTVSYDATAGAGACTWEWRGAKP